MAKNKAKKSKKRNNQSSKPKRSSGKNNNVEKRVPKRSVSAPKSLQEQKKDSADKVGKVVAKKKSVRKPRKRPMERWFWIILFALFIIIGSFGVYFVFKDYYNDSSTPSQKNIEDITQENIDYLLALDDSVELIEESKLHAMGPINYVIYTVPAGTPRKDSTAAVANLVKKAVEEKPEIFDTYDFQIFINNSGEEAEGVNDYPIIGSKNTGASLKWMDMEGKYTEPVEETE